MEQHGKTDQTMAARARTRQARAAAVPQSHGRSSDAHNCYRPTAACHRKGREKISRTRPAQYLSACDSTFNSNASAAGRCGYHRDLALARTRESGDHTHVYRGRFGDERTRSEEPRRACKVCNYARMTSELKYSFARWPTSALDHKPCIDCVGRLFALEPAEGGILHNKEPTIIPTESYGTHRVLRQVIAQFQFGIFQEARAP